MIDFNRLVERLGNRLQQPLPGPRAHEVLRAVPVGKTIPGFTHKLPPMPGSVLIVLYPDWGSVLFPLIKRTTYDGAHSGQISFPGGRAEPGESTIDTALREGNEEIGLAREAVKILGNLSDFFVIPSNFTVTPVVGYANERPDLVADPIEVAKILHGDIELILPESALLEKEIITSNIYQMKAPHFEIENEVVWGATAMMLNELRVVVKEVL